MFVCFKERYINLNLCLDLNELTLPKTCTTEFPDPDDLLNFKLTICPDEVCKQFNLIYCSVSYYILYLYMFFF